jgi:hypothetical protein
MAEIMPSTADKRVENNVMRHNYRVLSELEKDHMQQLKDLGLTFWNLCDQIGLHGAPERGPGSRELSLAKTKIEEAVMWAVKHITR